MDYYDYSIYLEKESNFNLSQIQNILQDLEIFKDAVFTLKAQELIVNLNGWKIYFTYVDKDFVIVEAQDIGKRYMRPQLSACSKRIEIYTDRDVEDKFYVLQLVMIESLYEVPNIHIFDPYFGEFLN